MDIAIVDTAGPAIAFNGTESVLAVRTSREIALNGGMLTVGDTLEASANLQLAGARVRASTIDLLAGATLVAGTNPNSRLLGPTVVNGDILVTAAGSSQMTIEGGLTLHGVLKVGSSDTIAFFGTQAFAAGTILFETAGGGVHFLSVTGTSNATLTIAPDATIRGGEINLGARIISPGAPGTQTLVNLGTISSDAAGNGIRIELESFSNQGLLEATAGANLEIFGTVLPWSNNGQIRATGAGASVNLVSAWSNTGSITAAAAGSVSLGGTFTTADVTGGRAVNVGGTMNLTGTLNNAGDVLTLDAASGSWTLFYGRIIGGTVNLVAPTSLSVRDGGRFSGPLAVNGSFNVTNGRLTIDGGFDLNGTLTLPVPSSLVFEGSQTFSGGTIVLENLIELAGSGDTTLTLAPGTTIRGGGGFNTFGGPTGGIGVSGLAAGVQRLVNQGTIIADVNDRGFFVGPETFENTGTVGAANGGRLVLYTAPGDQVLAGAVTVDALSALDIGGPLTGPVTDPADFNAAGRVFVFGPGTPASPRTIEALSEDRGLSATGFSENFSLGTLELQRFVYALVTDDWDNAPGAAPEAVYVDTLIVPVNTTLDLGGRPLYARNVLVSGQILNGQVRQLPDSHPIQTSTPTTGTLSADGELDEWTFYGRAGRMATVVLLPASDLFRAEVSLLSPTGATLAGPVITGSGAAAALSNIQLPADGTYRVRVRSDPGWTPDTGSYTVTVWDVTIRTETLDLGATEVGRIESLYHSDQWTFSAAAGQQVQFDLLAVNPRRGARFTLTGPNGFVGFSNLNRDSDPVTLAEAGQYTLTVTPAGSAATDYSFILSSTAVAPITLGVPHTGELSGSPSVQLFRFELPTTGPLLVRLDDASEVNANEVYLRRGLPPTRLDYDARYEAAASPDQTIVLDSAIAGDWYIMVYGATVAEPSSFTLEAVASELLVDDISPKQHGSTEPLEMTVTGAGFATGMQVQLVATSSGNVYTASAVEVDSLTSVRATFDMTAIAAGDEVFDVRVAAAGSSDALIGSFTYTPGRGSAFATRLSAPSTLGRHEAATLYITYMNTGGSAMRSPVLILSSGDPDGSEQPLFTLDGDEVGRGFWTSAIPEGYSTSVSILASGARAGWLDPGEEVTIPIYYGGLLQPWDTSDTAIELKVEPIAWNSPTAIDWDLLGPFMQPEGMNDAAWAEIISNVRSMVGATWGDYVTALASAASALEAVGDVGVTSVGELWSFIVAQARGLGPVSTLASAVDAAMITPGLPLTVSRSFGNDIAMRYGGGYFGQGWFSLLDTEVSVTDDGTVTIVSGQNGARRTFQPDSRYTNVYLSGAGDTGTFQQIAGTYDFLLTELSGTVMRFSDVDESTTGIRRRIDYIEDRHGNRIDFVYDLFMAPGPTGYAEYLPTGLVHSSGASLSLEWDTTWSDRRRVGAITDSAGRRTTFTYDDARQFLVTPYR